MTIGKQKAYILATQERFSALLSLVGALSSPGSVEKNGKVASAQRKVASTTAAYDAAHAELTGEAPAESDSTAVPADATADPARLDKAAAPPPPAEADTTKTSNSAPSPVAPLKGEAQSSSTGTTGARAR